LTAAAAAGGFAAEVGRGQQIHTQPFNGPFSGTTRVGQYQKGKTNLDFTEARDGDWQWHQLGHMQVCTSLQTDNHTSTPPLSFFTGRMSFLPPNQQRQSTEGISRFRSISCCCRAKCRRHNVVRRSNVLVYEVIYATLAGAG